MRTHPQAIQLLQGEDAGAGGLDPLQLILPASKRHALSPRPSSILSAVMGRLRIYMP